MNEQAPATLEEEIRAAIHRGAFDRAATLGLRGYGPEIFGYLIVVAGSQSDATEAFSMFCEDLWRGLPDFRGASSFKTWAYAIARNALHRYRRDPSFPHRRRVPLDDAREAFDIAQDVRTTTLIHLRTETKSAIRELRDQLDERERTLMVLRIDRQMAWREIAMIVGGVEASEDDLRRTAAACRKRFERAKETLRRLARERGLL
jgi:RNA polymerase sigma-70 factor, ECF subfamily